MGVGGTLVKWGAVHWSKGEKEVHWSKRGGGECTGQKGGGSTRVKWGVGGSTLVWGEYTGRGGEYTGLRGEGAVHWSKGGEYTGQMVGAVQWSKGEGSTLVGGGAAHWSKGGGSTLVWGRCTLVTEKGLAVYWSNEERGVHCSKEVGAWGSPLVKRLGGGGGQSTGQKGRGVVGVEDDSHADSLWQPLQLQTKPPLRVGTILLPTNKKWYS